MSVGSEPSSTGRSSGRRAGAGAALIVLIRA
jgi:hypothetical protein